MGRNVFQADRPGLMAAAVAQLVHTAPQSDRDGVTDRLALMS
jgi:2-amino-4,5-dihydroxy-6-oxo-7-(phosphonooxy)heptanoate synthase